MAWYDFLHSKTSCAAKIQEVDDNVMSDIKHGNGVMRSLTVIQKLMESGQFLLVTNGLMHILTNFMLRNISK